MFQITRRYAEFSAAIVGINQSYPNERAERVLGQLQMEVENFVLKSLKRGCTGSFESTLVKMPRCWKSHVAVHM